VVTCPPPRLPATPTPSGTLTIGWRGWWWLARLPGYRPRPLPQARLPLVGEGGGDLPASKSTGHAHSLRKAYHWLERVVVTFPPPRLPATPTPSGKLTIGWRGWWWLGRLPDRPRPPLQAPGGGAVRPPAPSYIVLSVPKQKPPCI
jgi:hypothetical protein